MAFTEFYVQTTGSNLNAGSTNADAAAFTYAGGTFVRATGVFTVASGNPLSDGVAVGDFASIYTTAGATVATFVARVTIRDATTITVDLTAIAGATSSVSETAAAATCKVGGAWAGPSTTVGFPINFATGTLKNLAGDSPRVNFKNGVTYAITAAITRSITGMVQFQGYTATPGDFGKAVLDGGVSATYYNILTVSGENTSFADFIFAHNGNTGSAADGVVSSGPETYWLRCVFHDFRRRGLSMTAVGHMIECEFYACNQSNTTNFGAVGIAASGSMALHCISHDNPGSNVDGFLVSSSASMIECISDTNGRHGVLFSADVAINLLGCDFYNNGAAGASIGTGSGALMANIQNCNFIKNTTYGILWNNAICLGTVYNNGFGVGTQANTSGDQSAVDGPDVSGSVSYGTGLTPWVDPANGDFRINLAAAKNTGRGNFTQTSGGSGTVGYPDIGAAQHVDVPVGGGGSAYALGWGWRIGWVKF